MGKNSFPGLYVCFICMLSFFVNWGIHINNTHQHIFPQLTIDVLFEAYQHLDLEKRSSKVCPETCQLQMTKY